VILPRLQNLLILLDDKKMIHIMCRLEVKRWVIKSIKKYPRTCARTEVVAVTLLILLGSICCVGEEALFDKVFFFFFLSALFV